MIEPQSYPKDPIEQRDILSEQKDTDVPVGRSEAWNALSACSFFSLAVSSFFSCPADPPNELIAGAKKILRPLSVLWGVRGFRTGEGEGEENRKGTSTSRFI